MQKDFFDSIAQLRTCRRTRPGQLWAAGVASKVGVEGIGACHALLRMAAGLPTDDAKLGMKGRLRHAG